MKPHYVIDATFQRREHHGAATAPAGALRWLERAHVQLMKPAGHWREPQGVPTGTLTWLPPPNTGGLKTHVAVIGGQAVATIRTKVHGRGYVVRIPGWIWFPHQDAPDGKMGVKESPVIAFAKLKEAKQAVADAMGALPVTTA